MKFKVNQKCLISELHGWRATENIQYKLGNLRELKFDKIAESGNTGRIVSVDYAYSLVLGNSVKARHIK